MKSIRLRLNEGYFADKLYSGIHGSSNWVKIAQNSRKSPFFTAAMEAESPFHGTASTPIPNEAFFILPSIKSNTYTANEKINENKRFNEIEGVQ